MPVWRQELEANWPNLTTCCSCTNSSTFEQYSSVTLFEEAFQFMMSRGLFPLECGYSTAQAFSAYGRNRIRGFILGVVALLA